MWCLAIWWCVLYTACAFYPSLSYGLATNVDDYMVISRACLCVCWCVYVHIMCAWKLSNNKYTTTCRSSFFMCNLQCSWSYFISKIKLHHQLASDQKSFLMNVDSNLGEKMTENASCAHTAQHCRCQNGRRIAVLLLCFNGWMKAQHSTHTHTTALRQ